MAVQPETLDSYDDRRLVIAFQTGEGDAFERIVGAHYSSLLVEARRRLRSAGDAEDAVQETLLRAYLALDRFGGEYRLRAWLSRILANTCADVRARHSGELRLVDRLAHRRDEAPGADERIADLELRRKVKDAIASLPETYRVAFVLREVEERSYAEVAEEMSVTESNARARVHRARNSLTRALRNTGTALSGFAVPLRLLRWRRFVARTRSVREPNLVTHPEAVQTSVSGVSSTALHSATLSSTPPAPLSALSQISQALTQTASSPLSQTILAITPDAGRASLPLAGMLATVAAAGAMAATGASVISPAASPAAAAYSVVAPQAALTSDSTAVAPAAQQRSATSAAGAGSPDGASASGASATSASGSFPGLAVSSEAWQWVSDAATGLGQIAPAPSGTGTSAPGSSAGADPVQTVGSPSSSTSSDPVACPWPSSFPTAAQGSITLPAPEPAGAAPSAYFASDSLEVNSADPAFEVAGQGNYEDQTGSATIHTHYGACLPGTTDPVLLADLSNPADPAVGQSHLAGALVSSSSVDGETIALYRGTATWIDGANASTPPSSFVAEVVIEVPSDISMLRVAFFGTAPDLSYTPLTCPDQQTGGTSTSTATTPGASTVTSSAPNSSTDAVSTSPNSGTGVSSSMTTGPTSTTSSVASGCSPSTSNAPSSSEPTGPVSDSSGTTTSTSSAGESTVQSDVSPVGVPQSDATSPGVQGGNSASSTSSATIEGTASTTTGSS